MQHYNIYIIQHNFCYGNYHALYHNVCYGRFHAIKINESYSRCQAIKKNFSFGRYLAIKNNIFYGRYHTRQPNINYGTNQAIKDSVCLSRALISRLFVKDYSLAGRRSRSPLRRVRSAPVPWPTKGTLCVGMLWCIVYTTYYLLSILYFLCILTVFCILCQEYSIKTNNSFGSNDLKTFLCSTKKVKVYCNIQE